MKFLGLIAILFSTSAWACPDLTGNFTCVQDGQSYPMNITQSDANGVMVYNVNGDAIPADGQRKSIPDDEYTRNASYVVSCNGANLVVNQDGTMLDNGNPVGTFNAEVNVSINADSNLSQISHTVLDWNGQRQEFDDNIVCTRN